jgi:hypothetical protein
MHLPSLLTSITLLTTAIAAPSSLKPRQGGWTVRDFTRDCADDGDNGPNSCTYVFTIDTSEVSQQCLIVDSAPQASLHSFYSVPCTEVCLSPSLSSLYPIPCIFLNAKVF